MTYDCDKCGFDLMGMDGVGCQCDKTKGASMKHTYNAVFDKHGVEAGLIYEELVSSFMSGVVCPVDLILSLGQHIDNTTNRASDLVYAAQAHAKQEIRESHHHSINDAVDLCLPVKLQINGVWDQHYCMLSNLTEHSVTAHFSTSMYVVCDLDHVTDVMWAIDSTEVSHLVNVAAKIY